MSSEREQRYRKAQAERGFKRVVLWIPEQNVEQIKRTVKLMQANHLEKLKE